MLPLLMDASLTLRLFGPMSVWIGGEPLPKMRSRKALWLLALLSTRANRPVSRQWIASTLWPNVDLATAYSNLRPALCDLRQALGGGGEWIRTVDRNALLLDLTRVDHDVVRFDAAMRRGDFAQAVELYRGPFLEGCNEEWAPQERDQREMDCIRALQTVGEQAMRTDDCERALAHFSRAATLDAWRDAPRRGQMQALANLGDINAALHVYREYAHYLRVNAGLTPDHATTELYGRLRTYAGAACVRPRLRKDARSA